jgi:hypothetical protein
VTARVSEDVSDDGGLERANGHVIKWRYTPVQTAVKTLEEMPEHAGVWDKTLEGLPVICCQLHSQIAPVLAGLKLRGLRAVYVMTDAACLALSFSRLVRDLKRAEVLTATITAGQAMGGDHETVTVHSALLAAKHILSADAVVIGQGPGNAGTGTRTGFGGIEQATLLDVTQALGGIPVACVRMSGAEIRVRHLGISHHTLTALALTRVNCIVPLPYGADANAIPSRHQTHFVEDCDRALDFLHQSGITVTSMGRTSADDLLAFQAAAASGLYAQDEN